jgi:hypothetical protein
MKFLEQNFYYLRLIGLRLEYGGFRGMLLKIFLLFSIIFMCIYITLGSYHIILTTESFIDFTDSLSIMVCVVEPMYRLLWVYFHRKEFKEFIEYLTELSNIGKTCKTFSELNNLIGDFFRAPAARQ